MDVLDQRITPHISIARSDGNDRQLALERDQPLDDRGTISDRCDCGIDVGTRTDDRLAPPVVTLAPRLDDAWTTDLLHRTRYLRRARSQRVSRCRDTAALEQLLLPGAILSLRQRLDRRVHI